MPTVEARPTAEQMGILKALASWENEGGRTSRQLFEAKHERDLVANTLPLVSPPGALTERNGVVSSEAVEETARALALDEEYGGGD
jgi:hypothetical protein